MGFANPRRWTVPFGLSVLLNLMLLGLAVRLLLVPTSSAERMSFAVELERLPVPRTQPQEPPKQIELPPPVETPVQESISQKPLPKQAKKVVPSQTAPKPDSGPVRVGLSGTSATGGGTLATGPGAYSGHGDGGGVTGHGGGNPGSTPPSPPKQEQPHPVKPIETPKIVPPPPPEPPKPAPPKGETRGPKLTRQTRPVYPQEARDDQTEGVVVLVAQVAADGRVTKTRVERSSGDRRLDKAACQAVENWVYKPALRDGEPVTSSVRVRVEFRLE